MEQEENAILEGAKVDFGALFEGTELSEEIKGKVSLIFETALAAKVSAEVAVIQEEYAVKFDAQLDEVKGELVEQIDTFLNYAVAEWIAENKVAVESGLRTEITEDFITGLKALFVENYIEVPEEKFELVSEMEAEVVTLKSGLDEQIAKNIALTTTIGNLIKESVIADVAKGLTATDAEKLKTLVEGVDFDTEQSYKEKLVTIKENYFPKVAAPKDNQLDEAVVENGDVTPVATDAQVKAYADAISRQRF
jgi:hypothetical protein